ncbi:MAG: hypothetical protein AAGA48_39985 [Myxococcota bacterium]
MANLTIEGRKNDNEGRGGALFLLFGMAALALVNQLELAFACAGMATLFVTYVLIVGSGILGPFVSLGLDEHGLQVRLGRTREAQVIPWSDVQNVAWWEGSEGPDRAVQIDHEGGSLSVLLTLADAISLRTLTSNMTKTTEEELLVDRSIKWESATWEIRTLSHWQYSWLHIRVSRKGVRVRQAYWRQAFAFKDLEATQDELGCLVLTSLVEESFSVPLPAALGPEILEVIKQFQRAERQPQATGEDLVARQRRKALQSRSSQASKP